MKNKTMRRFIIRCRIQARLILSLLFIFSFTSYSQSIPEDSLYLGQTPPGTTPKIFELPVNIGLHAVERIAISSDGKEIYYGELDTWPSSDQKIKCFKYLNKKWQGPFIVFNGYIAPGLSINDSVMYIQKNLNNNTVACTYFSIRNDTGWSTPVRLLSTDLQSHYFQETKLKNCYLASILPNSPGGNSDLCKLVTHNSDTTMQSLGVPINTLATENDFFIARDESYIIFCRFSNGSSGDLFISYNRGKGNWTNPKTLGAQVNAPNPVWECCPFVTNDNKYLFFTRGGNEMSSYFTYWTKVDKLIDSLKFTNFTPYVKNQIPNRVVVKDSLYVYQIPDSIFYDDNGNNTLTYSATKSNGDHLPGWLLFDSGTRTFSGTPTETGTSLSIKVTATDSSNESTSLTFNITIVNPSGREEDKNQLPKESTLFQNYPNPFNPATTIQYSKKSLPALSKSRVNIL
jgi:hypothetical protein